MATLRIRNATTGESIALSRDVRHSHPAWVHAQLGTGGEAALQHCLEQMYYDDFATRPDQADVCGVYMSAEDAQEYLSSQNDLRRAVSTRQITIQVKTETRGNRHGMLPMDYAFRAADHIMERLASAGLSSWPADRKDIEQDAVRRAEELIEECEPQRRALLSVVVEDGED